MRASSQQTTRMTRHFSVIVEADELLHRQARPMLLETGER